MFADALFTATAVVIQPTTGIALALVAGYPLSAHWLFFSILLYAIVGYCWLPVVWIQVRMKRLAEDAALAHKPLPPEYHRYFRWWFALGWPAFLGVLGIFYLMVAKPA